MVAFPQANDVSPNTAGPRCIDTGEACDYETSTCNGKVCTTIIDILVFILMCSYSYRFTALNLILHDVDTFDSTRIIGENQYHFARYAIFQI